MIKFTKIHIEGFQDDSRIIDFDFSNENITVIYGNNGCGKTTFLKILHAILDKDEECLLRNSVKNIQLDYKYNDQDKTLKISVEDNKVNWGRSRIIYKTKSILSGVQRGVLNNIPPHHFNDNDRFINEKIRKLHHEIEMSSRHHDMHHRNMLRSELHRLKSRQFNIQSDHNNNNGFLEGDHVLADTLPIDLIEKALVKTYYDGILQSTEKVKNAFFTTIENAIDIELKQEENELDESMWNKLEERKEFLLGIFSTIKNSDLKSRIITFLNSKTKKTKLLESRIFRALLINIINSSENQNTDLLSINKLIDLFNERLYKEKELIVNENRTYIKIDKRNNHNLNKLSSGERHFLSFLTLFLIVGRGRDFYFIDEPEISLNMKWQRELLPLMSELSPNSQIIVATHSPSISNSNSNYLSELI